jgi:IclR family acetate operon transcriptional repressor
MGAKRTRSRGTTIQALVRADAILEVILCSPEGKARLSEIARATGLNKTTAFNLAESLVSLRYLVRDETAKSYGLGLRNLQLGQAVQRHSNLAEASLASMMRLCRDTGETVNLAIPYVFEAMIVDSLEGSFTVRVTSYAGTPAPYHSTSCGKAILAHLGAERRESIYAVGALASYTPNTITDVGVLEQELKTVREKGFATDIEENELGAHCVAVPISDAIGEVIGSISVAGPTTRLKADDLPGVAELISRETRLITERLHRMDGTSPPIPARRRARSIQ